MIKDSELIEVQNLTNGKIAYIVPETNRFREFVGQQKRKIEAGELRLLYSTVGGKALIEQYLSIKNRELAEEFNITSDVYDNEYNWTQDDVDEVLKNGSLDVLKDALEFGPDGIKDLIVSRAVALKIPDNNKLTAIQDFTGRNIANMIKINESLNEDEAPAKTSRRRASKKSDSGDDAPKRRASTKK